MQKPSSENLNGLCRGAAFIENQEFKINYKPNAEAVKWNLNGLCRGEAFIENQEFKKQDAQQMLNGIARIPEEKTVTKHPVRAEAAPHPPTLPPG